MRSYLIISAIALATVVLLAINPTMLALAFTIQETISPSMRGFAFTSNGCCPDVSISLNGNIVTNSDGTTQLLQQNGRISIDSASYNLQFIPNAKLDVQSVNNGCSLGTTYNQNGEIDLIESDGTIVKGSGIYSWGAIPDCSGGVYTFTNFSGDIQDSKGQMTKFFTGTDSLPDFQ